MSRPPTEPFRIRGDASCDPDLKAAATRLLSDLTSHFAGGELVGTPTEWNVERRTSSAGRPYYVLRSDETGGFFAMLSCGSVAGVSRRDVLAKGYDGEALPAFNFAPELGLYVLTDAPSAAGTKR